MRTVLGVIVIILILLAVILLWCIGVFGPIFAIVCLLLGRKRKRWLVSGLILLPLCLMILIGLIGFDFPMGYVGRERRTYEKTAVQVEQEDTYDGAFMVDDVCYEHLGLSIKTPDFEEKITEPIFHVRYESYALFRNYGYNFYRVPNEAGLDLVVCGLKHYIYCPTDQKEAALAYYNDPARQTWLLTTTMECSEAIPDEVMEELHNGYNDAHRQELQDVFSEEYRRWNLVLLSDEVVRMDYAFDLVEIEGVLYYPVEYTYENGGVSLQGVALPPELQQRVEAYI